jgi:hypothetical protein
MVSRASAAELRDAVTELTDSDAILPISLTVPVQIGFRHKYPSFAFDLHSSTVQYSMPFGTKLGARLAYSQNPLSALLSVK